MSRELMNARSENEDELLFDLSTVSSTSRSSQFGALNLGVNVGVHDDSDESVSGEQSAPAAANAPKPDVGAKRDGLRLYLYIQMQLCNESLEKWLDKDNSLIAHNIKTKSSSPGSELTAVQMRNRRFVFILFSQMVSAIAYIH